MPEYGLTVDSLLPAGRTDLIAEVSRAGFTTIGLGIPDVQESTHILLKEAGMRCHELMAIGFGDDFDQTMISAERAAVAAAKVNAEWVLGYFSQVGQETPAMVRRASEIISAAGSKLALEFTGVSAPTRLNDVRTLAEGALPSSTGIIIDTWHVSFGDSRNWEDLRSLPVDQIAYVQFNDHGILNEDDRLGESMHKRLWPGKGTLELDRFVDLLRAKGWDGPVSVEVLNQDYRNLPLRDYCEAAYQSTVQFWNADR